jgi:hypothetical protein
MPVLEVQRYFFGVGWSDHEDDDPNGALLSDNAAALNYADRLIRELKERGRYNDPNLMVIVRDGMKKVVLSLSSQRAPQGALWRKQRCPAGTRNSVRSMLDEQGFVPKRTCWGVR